MKKWLCSVLVAGAGLFTVNALAESEAVWNYKLDSRLSYYGNNDFPEWATIVPDGDRTVLQIQNNDATKAHTLVKFLSPAEFAKVKGKKVNCTIMVKGDNIAGKGCAKFMLMVSLPNKKTDWPQANIGAAGKEWRLIEFSYDVPYAAESVAMIIGLESASGTIMYKDMKITVSEE